MYEAAVTVWGFGWIVLAVWIFVIKSFLRSTDPRSARRRSGGWDEKADFQLLLAWGFLGLLVFSAIDWFM